MSKIFVYGDAHIQSSAPYSQPVEGGLTTHLMEVLDWYRWLQTTILSLQPNLVVDLGDIFSSYGTVDVRALTVGVEGVNAIESACRKVNAFYYLVIGNHDLYHGLIHNAPFFPGIIVLSPKVMETYDGQLVGFVSYGRSIKELPTNGGDPIVVFTHNDYREIPYFTGHRPEQGDAIGKFGGRMIVNGHYHVPKMHSIGNMTFLNAGSVGARNFRDCVCSAPGDPIRHGAWLLNIDGEEITTTFLENPNTSYWLQIDGNDVDAANRLSEDPNLNLIGRVNLRVETSSPAFPVRDILYSDRYNFKHIDVVTLPSIAAPLEGSQSEASDAITINPLEMTLEYLRLLNTDGGIPELIDYDQVYEFVVDLVNRVSDETPARPESVPLRLATITLTNFFSLGDVSWNLSPGLSAVIGENQDISGPDTIYCGKVSEPMATDIENVEPVTLASEDSHYENNGSGKTALFEGIFWTLTGKTIRGVSGTEIIREGEKQCNGILTIQVGENIYTISRTQAKRAKGAHVLEVYMDGEDITTRLQDGTHTVITELINLDEDLLMHLVFLMGGLQTSMTKLKPLQRFQLIERLVGDLSIFDSCAKAVNTAINTAKTEQDERNGEIKSIADNKVRYNQELIEKQSDLQQLNASLGVRSNELNSIIHTAQNGIDSGNTEVIRLNTVLEGISPEAEAVSAEYNELNQARQSRLQEQTEIYSNIKHFEERQREQRALIDAGKCPTCGADTETADRASEIGKLATGVSQETERKAAVDSQLNEMNVGLQELQEKQRGLAERSEACGQGIRTVQNAVTSQQHELSCAQLELQELDGKLAQAEARINFLVEELGVMDDRAMQAQTVVEELDKKLAMLRFLYHAPAKSGIFSPMGVRSHVVNMLLSFLNDRCAEYSRYMLPEGQKVMVTSAGSTKDGKPVSKLDLKVEGIKRSYASMSAGESRRLDIVLHLALRDLAQASSKFNMNFLVLDEVLDPLDSAGIRDVLRLLDTFSSNASVWVVTQSNQLRGEMESGILVVKKDGVSTVYPLESG